MGTNVRDSMICYYYDKRVSPKTLIRKSMCARPCVRTTSKYSLSTVYRPPEDLYTRLFDGGARAGLAEGHGPELHMSLSQHVYRQSLSGVNVTRELYRSLG